MTTLAPTLPLSIEEYLEMESRSRVKHHYNRGQLENMPGGTLKHNMISSNVITAINIALKTMRKPYLVSNSDTKIWIPAIKSFYYPDAVVICEVPEYYGNRKDVIINPLLIVEVASPATENFDRSGKFLDYATIDTFKEYLLLDQDQPYARQSQRVNSDTWQMSTIQGMDQYLELKSIGCLLSMQDVYDKTDML
ncbi:MAG TPA: Uma2 family endonuclease [Saprospirales bacterium]|nr:Uma2 family endonuclease [Saprospirales bacterium]